MNNDLKLLIDHYEAEQRLLQSLLDECLLEEDYKYARYYRKNLWLLEKFLFNLYSLADKEHAEKTEIRRLISNIEFLKKSRDDDFMSAFSEKRVQELNAKLDILNQKPLNEVEEKHDIENAIIWLLEKEINGFKLFAEKKFNLYLDFKLIEADIIHIEFTPFKDLIEYSFDNLFHDSETEALHRNGFKLNDEKNILYINFDLTSQSTQSLMIFLSRIFFGILHWNSKKNFQLEIY